MHLVGRELLAGGADAAVLELLVLAGGQGAGDFAQLGAQPRAEERQIRLQLDARDRPLVEEHLLDVQLVRDLVLVTRDERGAANEHAPERLAQRNACLSARLMPELDDPPHLGHLGQHRRVRRGRLGPAGEVHRRGRAVAGAAHEVLPQVLGEERHQRRDQAQRLHDRPPERAEARAS